jgi:hypothetical protein
MESIPYMTNTSMTIEPYAAPMNRFALMFDVPNLRPPIFDEMEEDLERLIAKVARERSDQSCPELNYDELVAEGRAKLAYVLCDKRVTFKKVPTRVHFFRFFATALNNHVRSLVHKFRFTEKRTGVKPPPKEERFSPVAAERIKTAEVRLDDEEVNLQVADKPCESAKSHETAEIMADYESVLNPIEVMVFRQLAEPNQHALTYAQCDANIGRKPGDPFHLKIKHEHLAKGLSDETSEEFPLELFEKIVLRIRQKITEHRSMTQLDEQAKVRRNVALAQLEQVFNLQIPTSIDEIVVRRLLTICARDQYDKIEANPVIKEWLLEVGAKVPEIQGDILNCRGVAYQKNNRICNSCGYRVACAGEAANFGLGKITISPRLLGSKLTRVPAILPNDPDAEEVVAPSDEEAEIVAYLDENFRKMASKGQTYYAHKEKLDQSKRLFRVDTNGADFRIQVCGPSEALRSKLRYEQKCYFTPPGLSISAVIALIDQHAKETYAVA